MNRGRRSVLKTLRDKLDQVSFILKESPELTFCQLYNRLQWEVDDKELIKEKLESELSRFVRPWFRSLNKLTESAALIRTFSGHRGSVYACAFSPNGNWLVSASEDKTLMLWKPETGEELVTFKGHTGAVYTCAISPDGKQVLSGSSDKTLRLWDLETGRDVLTLGGHSGAIFCCAFSPDGKQVLSASSDKTLKLWDTKTGKEVLTFSGHTGEVNACAFAPDGKRIVSGCSDQSLKLWDAETGQELETLKRETAARNIAVTQQGIPIVNLDNAETTERFFQITDGGTKAVNFVDFKFMTPWVDCSFSPNGKRILSILDADTVDVWDADTGSLAFALKGHTDWVNACTFSPDGKWLASSSKDETIILWDLASGGECAVLKGHTSWIYACVFSPDGKRLASASRDKTVRLWNVDTATESMISRDHLYVDRVFAFRPDGKVVVSGSKNEKMVLWDTDTFEVVNILKPRDRGVIDYCAISADGRLLASGGSEIKLWDIDRGAELKTLKRRGRVWDGGACIFGPDNTQLVLVSKDGDLWLWDTSTGDEARLPSLEGHEDRINVFAFCPDGRRIVSGSKDRTLKLWNAHTGTEILTFRGHADQVTACAFSPDGSLLSSGSMDMTVRLWDTRTGQELETLRGHSEMVYVCAFSPDGKRLLSGSEDKTLRLWDLKTGKELAVLKGFLGRVKSCLFSPDGRRIVSTTLGQPISFSLDNLAIFSPVITPYVESDQLWYRCQYCREKQAIENEVLGKEIVCPACGRQIILNSFVLDLPSRTDARKKTSRDHEEADAEKVDEALKLIQSGNSPRAESLFRDVCSRCPESDEYEYVKQGKRFVKYWTMEEFTARAMRRGIEANQDVVWQPAAYPRACFCLACILVERGDYHEGLRWLEKGRSMEPRNPNFLLEQGFVHFKLGSPRKALECYKDALGLPEILPHEVARALRGIGVQLIDLGCLDEAEAKLKESLDLEPDNEVAENELKYIAQQRAGAALFLGRREDGGSTIPRTSSLKAPISVSIPHPGADADEAARQNIVYQQQMTTWKSLSWLKRWKTKKPKKPQGI